MKALRFWRRMALAVTILTVALIAGVCSQYIESGQLNREQAAISKEIEEMRVYRDSLLRQLESVDDSCNIDMDMGGMAHQSQPFID